MKYLKLFDSYNFLDKEILTIKKFLYYYELYQSNHYGDFDYDKFYDIYMKLPDNFKKTINYTGSKKLYRGQETKDIPNRKILSFTKSNKYASFIGRIIISTKDINFNYTTVDSEKIYKFIEKNKLPFEIGDDEDEVLIIKI
jgi:hypothetical protein